MRRNRLQWLPVAAALLCFVIGLAMTARTLREAPRRKAVLADKLERLEALDRMAAGGMDDAPARLALERLERKTPPALDTLLQAALPGANIAIRPEASQPLDQSWFLRPVEVRIPDAPLTRLWAAIEQCEKARPPWRLVACSMESTPDKPGTVTATLRLEALHKEEI